jgi:Fur family peroxide stress response transcriptional regulator
MNKLTPDKLREAGLKATPIRIRLLEILEHAEKPMTFSEIVEGFGKKGIDQVTLYRALDAFSEKELIREMHLASATPYYELITDEHHHIVCNNCGRIEDFSLAECDALERSVLRKSKAFGQINRHSIELYGICKKCLST